MGIRAFGIRKRGKYPTRLPEIETSTFSLLPVFYGLKYKGSKFKPAFHN
jgi:hypothetical protein